MTKVLVIDDSMLVRTQVSRTLGGAGFEVIQAIDGVDALTKVTDDAVKLIVCDVNMPKMGGLEFLQALATDGLAVGVPIVMLTTEGQPDLIQRAKQLGAKGWIV